MTDTGTVNVHDVRTDALIVITESQLLNTLVGVVRERHAPTQTLRQARGLVNDLERVIMLYRARLDGEPYGAYERALDIDVYPEAVDPEWQSRFNGGLENA